MRFARQLVVAAVVGAGLVVAGGGVADAQLGSCNGNKVVDHAPYSCSDTKVISNITFTAQLDVDAAGKATVTYTMDPVQTADVPIAVHSYTDISLGPKQFINGTIPAGQTTATLVVPRIECGQLDIKAVFTTPGDSSGNIAGPVVTWGDVCQTVPTTATTAPTTVSPSSVSPSSVSPTNVQPTIPSTGTAGVVPWTWALPPLALAAFLIFLSRFRRPSPS
jgi:hypothetical protein